MKSLIRISQSQPTSRSIGNYLFLSDNILIKGGKSMTKRIKESSRIIIKEQKGIVTSEKKSKSCRNCYYYSSRRVCSKHLIITGQNELCKDFSSKQIKVYRGGSASP